MVEFPRSELNVLGLKKGIEIYAVIEIKGKQYKVNPGQVVDVDRLDVSEGDSVELDRVLLIADADKVMVGTPTVGGAKVMATSQGEGRGKKIIVFRYKSKTRYRRKTGHRQSYTRLAIDSIIGLGATGGEPVKNTRRRKREVTASGS